MAVEYDCIVVGAGIEGLSTAAKLAERQKSVLLLEQFPLLHTRGSSSGATRLTRLAYNKPQYVELARESNEEWKRLQSYFGLQLYKKTGMLIVGPADDTTLKKYDNSMKQSNLECKHLSRKELQDAYGSLFNIPENYRGVCDPEGALLDVKRCLQAYLKRFVDSGGKVIDNCPVRDIHPGKSVKLTTEDGSQFQASSVVLTMGPWTPKFLKEKLDLSVPVEILRTVGCYWRENQKGQYSADNGVPAVSIVLPQKDGLMFKPSDEYPGLIYYGVRMGVPCDPDNPPEAYLAKYVEKCRNLAGIFQLNIQIDAPVDVTPCFYQECVDGDYILDSHPRHRNIVFGTGFSGHGFKMAPVVGDILANLALGHKSEQQERREMMFTLRRFSKSE